MAWRRSYDVRPPDLDRDSEFSQFHDPRYADIPASERPVAECLKDVVARMVPYFTSDIAADLKDGKTVLLFGVVHNGDLGMLTANDRSFMYTYAKDENQKPVPTVDLG